MVAIARLGAMTCRTQRSADPLGQFDDDPLRAPHIAEPEEVAVTLHLDDELPTVGAEASEDVIEIVDGEGDVSEARGVRRRARVAAGARRGVELHELEPSVAVR